MRTPDSAAGKKGRCPHCGELTRIPSTSQTSASESERRLAASATVTGDRSNASQNQGDRIEFPCPQCGRPVRTPSTAAGKKGKCPSCGVVVQIPKPSPSKPAHRSATKTTASRSQAAGKARKPSAALEFPCPKCQKQIRTPASAVGKKGKCPKCGAVLRIPAGKTRSAAKPRRTATGSTPVSDNASGLTPLSDDQSGLLPLGQDDLGLTPLDDGAGGLTPLGDDTGGLIPLDDDSSGLTPLSDPGGLTPLGDDGGLVPLNSDPLGGDPFSPAAAAAPNPFSDAYAPTAAPPYSRNPYQSPTYASRGYQSVNEWAVKAPGIAMMAVSGISLIMTIVYFISSGMEMAAFGRAAGDEGATIVVGVVLLVVFVIAAAVYGLMFLGGFKMFRMESWGLALTGAILMVFPCTFFCMGIPVGIWAIVVLSLSNVRRAFD
jgi:predicted RNA-binding Zn-ribbon protein involved in translation (DUF1610 family)